MTVIPYRLSTRELMSTITLELRVPKTLKLRIRVAAGLLKAAGWVAGCGTLMSIEGCDAELNYTACGIPTALSIERGYRGYHRQALEIGCNLVIKLDGEVVSDVVAYDTRAGVVHAYRWSERGQVHCNMPVLHHFKGKVTVERKPA